MNPSIDGNIIRIFLEVAERHPEKVAIIEGERVLTYAEMRADVLRVAGYLHEHGIEPGTHVLIFVPMSIDLYEILLAIFHLGGVAVFIDAWADRKRLAAACRAAAPAAFIGTTRAQLLRLVSPEIRRIPVKLRANIRGWRHGGTPPPPARVDPDSPALMTFTTGSTGAPKGAKRSGRFLVAQHRALVASLEPRPGDVDMPVLPIFTLSNLAAGVTTVIPPVDPRSVEKFDPEEVVRTIRRRKVSTTSGSPAFYEKLARHSLEQKIGLPELQRIFLGGAPVFPGLARLLLNAFPDTATTIIYGSTEAEPISLLPAGELVRRSGEGDAPGLLVGRPVSLIEVAIMPIVDGVIELGEGEGIESMKLPAGEPGEICVAGEHVLREYYGGPEITRATKIRDGGRLWHRTGDAGYINAAGELFLLGRVRQSFEHHGSRIFPFPIEAKLREIDGVEIGTILNIDERLVIVAEPEKGSHSSPEQIEMHLRAAGIPFDTVQLRDSIPRDPRHHSKIDYEKLRISRKGAKDAKS